MSNLTPELEERFYWLKEMCTGASEGDRDIGPLSIRDKVVELEELVEDARTPKCAGCGKPIYALGLLSTDLCPDCYMNAACICPQCDCLFSPRQIGGVDQVECDGCIADSVAHREEVQRAHAATNGTL